MVDPLALYTMYKVGCISKCVVDPPFLYQHVGELPALNLGTKVELEFVVPRSFSIQATAPRVGTKRADLLEISNTNLYCLVNGLLLVQ